MPALVKPEFGPSLPELAGPSLRALPRWVLWVAAALSVLVVALAIGAWLVTRTPTRKVEVKSPVAFSMSYPSDQLRRLPASGPDVVRLVSVPGAANGAELVVRRVELPRLDGMREAAYPLVAQGLIEQMRREDSAFILRGEQPVNFGGQAGFQIYYQTERDGRTWYGRRVLLFSDDLTDRVGVDLNAVEERPQKGVPGTVWEVANVDPLLSTVRSVRLAGQP